MVRVGPKIPSARLKTNLRMAYFGANVNFFSSVELDESRGDGSCPQSRALDQIKTMTIGLFRT
jgi:hypothetical protein